MRKTVKQSIVLWPLAASTIISSLSAAALWVPPVKRHLSVNATVAHPAVRVADPGQSLTSWLKQQFRSGPDQNFVEPPPSIRRMSDNFQTERRLASADGVSGGSGKFRIWFGGEWIPGLPRVAASTVPMGQGTQFASLSEFTSLPEIEEIFPQLPQPRLRLPQPRLRHPRVTDRSQALSIEPMGADTQSSNVPLNRSTAEPSRRLHLLISPRTLAKPISIRKSDWNRGRDQTTTERASDSDQNRRFGGGLTRETPTDWSTMQIAAVPAPHRYVSVAAASWPATPALDELLNGVLSQARSRDELQSAWTAWSDDVSLELGRLRSLPRLADPAAAPILRELDRLGHRGIAWGEAADLRIAQIEMLRTAAALIRRTEVWSAIHSNLQDAPDGLTDENLIRVVSPDTSESAGHDVAAAIQVLHRDLDQTGDVEGWRQYLLLDEISAALADPVIDRLKLSQRLLGRLHWHAVDFDGRDFLQRRSVNNLATAIRPWAGGAVDYVKLLLQIERQESDPTAATASEIADAIATLGHSDDPAVRDIAMALATHYQNANVRFAISESLVNRFVPTIDPQTVPLNTTLLGSRIRGQSTVNTELAVRLRPAADRWSLNLLSGGNVATDSTGTRDGVSIRTVGQNYFVAGKPIEITADSLLMGDTNVSVRGQTRLRGIETRYDGWPLVGSLVQSIAGSEFERVRPLAQRSADGRIRDEIRHRVDEGVEQKTNDATVKLTEMLVGPLSRLRLEPGVVELQTTDDRLLARYRVAGQWQLAAFTPRPRALSSSLMSAQVHQSVFNNTIEQLIPRGEPMTIREIVDRSARTLNQSAVLPDDIPDDVTVQFADTRPVTIEIEDDRLWVTMRIASLRRDTGRALTKFIVRACYRAESDGLNARLVREGHLSIRGPGMSMGERLPIRLIFNKVLSDDRPIQLTLPALANNPAAAGLTISQLELRDGWIALSVSETGAPRIALR